MSSAPLLLVLCGSGASEARRVLREPAYQSPIGIAFRNCPSKIRVRSLYGGHTRPPIESIFSVSATRHRRFHKPRLRTIPTQGCPILSRASE